MPNNKTKAEYDIQYAKEKLKRIPLNVQKGKYEEIKAAADSAGETVNGYIKKAIEERIGREYAYTTEDIYALPDGERAELIDGQIYYTAPPNRRHQAISFALSRKIADYIDEKGGTCKVYPAPFAVFLNEDDINYVEPDISVICDTDKLDDKGCSGAPDWIVEVVSPGSRQMDYCIKLFKYRLAGVREYWIIDPDKDKITVWDLAGDNMEEYTLSDTVAAKIYGDFAIDFAALNF